MYLNDQQKSLVHGLFREFVTEGCEVAWCVLHDLVLETHSQEHLVALVQRYQGCNVAWDCCPRVARVWKFCLSLFPACRECRGSGAWNFDDCPWCDGTGREITRRT